MKKISDRDRLLRIVQGGDIESSIYYDIDYSLDIRGNITIWGGSSFLSDEALPMIDNLSKRVNRHLIPLYEYNRLSPYTARVYQMEQELDDKLSDDTLIAEFNRFREERPTEGFGHRFLIENISSIGETIRDDEGRVLSPERSDRQEVHDRLLKQERQDILNLWGVDCPPDINSSENYGKRLSRNQGQVSDWFETEFTRIGGDLSRHWNRTR